MPRAPKVKPAKGSKPSPSPARPTSAASTTLDKDLVIQILLARLDCPRSFDWHELSQKLNFTSAAKSPLGKGKGKGRGTVKAEEGGGLSGTELRDIYHEVILPSIRRGAISWEQTFSNGSTSPPTTPDSCSSSNADLTTEAKRNGKGKPSRQVVEVEIITVPADHDDGGSCESEE